MIFNFKPARITNYATAAHSHIAYADAIHNHDGVYSFSGHNHTGVYATAGHTHSGVYAAASHSHSGVYAVVNHNHSSLSTAGGSLTIHSTTGVATFTENVNAPDFILTSDRRVKKDIESLKEGVDGLKPVKYKLKGSKLVQYGFIAQEMLETHKELVRGSENRGYSISQNSITALLVKEVIELKKQLNKKSIFKRLWLLDHFRR